MKALSFISWLSGSALALLPFSARADHQIHPALEVTLFASEPDLLDPVGLTFDELGRGYVVEMRDYPLGMGAERKPGGAIRLLEDTNGDGRADRSTVFATGLSYPTSIAVWNGGVFVTAPPDILFLKDTTGDGRADVREVAFTGFRLGVTDGNVNGLRWGLDNRIHGINGGHGGEIRSPGSEVPPLNIRNLDFSFDPATKDFRTTYRTGGGFGLAFDEWGRSFTTHNIDHILLRAVPVRYLERFPGVPPKRATFSISDHGGMARIYAVSVAETRPNHPEQAGHFSSAGGMGYIGFDIYPGDLPGSVLVGDVVGNLIHRDLLAPDGPLWRATRSPEEQTSEFFASRDSDCRPVGVELGPDGALYLLDMQRRVIEHPDYIPEKMKQHLDLRAGEDRGRIYRILPRTGLPPAPPMPGTLSAEELANRLGHPNSWQRATAQRLLVERQARDIVPRLGQLMHNSPNALARLHAAWTLHGLGALEEEHLLSALADPEPGLRENALQMAERLLPHSHKLQAKTLAMAGDPSARVRFQTALTLGESGASGPAINEALLAILEQDLPHEWSRMAVLSSIRSDAEKLFSTFVAGQRIEAGARPEVLMAIEELSELIGARTGAVPAGPEEVLDTLRRSKAPEQVLIAALTGLETGIARAASDPAPRPVLAQILEEIVPDASPALLTATWRLSRRLGLPEGEASRQALARARMKAVDRELPEPQRIEQVRLLGLGQFEETGPVLFALIEGIETATLQTEALEVLRQFTRVEIAEGLIARWRGLAPNLRPAVISLLVQRRPYHAPLITAIEEGQLRLGELNLDLEQRRRLLRQSSPDIHERAARLIGDEEYSNRKEVVDQWLAKLPAEGNAARGREWFALLCAQCHVAGDLGVRVGPDLAGQSYRSIEDFVSNILDPNMAIQPAYAAVSVETVQGEFEAGILEVDTPEAVVLLQAQGHRVTIPRPEIVRMEATGISLMPEGLEAGLTPSDLRDLIEFLQVP